MMKKSLVLAAFLGVAYAPGVMAADADEPNYVYATYMYCDASQEWRADEIVKNVVAPAYDAATDAGEIGGWGWMAHQTGGKWRRILYWTTRGTDGLIDGARALDPRLDPHERALDALSAICPSHDDYVWEVGVGSGDGGVSADRGKAGFSVYLKCKAGKEERADEIVEKVLGPIYDSHVKAGRLASWGWLKHYIGGSYRRLATTTAADHKSLLRARTAVLAELGDKHPDALAELNEICGSHQDYMWDIRHEK